MAKAIEGVVLSGPIRLEKYDPDGDSYVVFQRPARWEREKLDEMQARVEYEWDSAERGKVRQRNHVPPSRLETQMVAMCLVECNIPAGAGHPIVKEGALLFVPGQSCRQAHKFLTGSTEEAFKKVWDTLPDDLAEEIIAALMEFHPPFNWKVPQQGEE